MEDFQEFPKILHLGGNPDDKYLIVFSAEEEEAADGFSVASFDEKPEPEKRKPGRPRKEVE